jgi:hypothetical protein
VTEPGRSMWAALQLLDRQVIDRNGVSIGKVDDLELTPSDEPDGLPIVSGILCGQAALARRFNRRLGRGVQHLRRVIDPADDPRPGCIPFGTVIRTSPQIVVDLERRDAPTAAVEQWLGREVVSRIPGGRR